ncbi:MAG: hypothetical protein P8M04_10220 [Akkermansiaceae bacterium]|nr:hypothetical protein [Akkermansiaceae bacterium]
MNKLRLFSIASFASISIFLASCGEKKDEEAQSTTEANTEAPEAEVAKQDTYDSLIDETIVQLNKLGDAFESAKDKASGKEFVKKLSVIADEIESISARMDKLETPSDQELARLGEKIENSTKNRDDQFRSFFERFLTNDELGENVGSAMTEFQARMDKLPQIFRRGDKKKAPPAPPAPTDPASVPTPVPAAQ